MYLSGVMYYVFFLRCKRNLFIHWLQFGLNTALRAPAEPAPMKYNYPAYKEVE